MDRGRSRKEREARRRGEETPRRGRTEDRRDSGAAARDRKAAAEDAPPAKSGAEILEEIRSAEAEVPEPPAPQIRYIERGVSKPGHFPQFEKIAVRTPPSSDAT